jgi:hypothetical protein
MNTTRSVDHYRTAENLLAMARGHRWRMRRRASIVALAQTHIQLARLEILAASSVDRMPPAAAQYWRGILQDRVGAEESQR